MTLKLNITNYMANFISQSLKCSNLTPDSFLNNPLFLIVVEHLGVIHLDLQASKFKNIPNYPSFFECCRPKMFILLLIGVASLCLCVCKRDKPLVLLLVHLHEGMSVVKMAFCGTERKGIYCESVKQMQNN